LREELPIKELVCDPEAKQLVVETHFPDEHGTTPVTLKVTPVRDGPFVEATITAAPNRAMTSWDG
jgi:hypothetical protein